MEKREPREMLIVPKHGIASFPSHFKPTLPRLTKIEMAFSWENDDIHAFRGCCVLIVGNEQAVDKVEVMTHEVSGEEVKG